MNSPARAREMRSRLARVRTRFEFSGDIRLSLV
jgi:hypothetical protein